MRKGIRNAIVAGVLGVATLGTVACTSDADVVNENLSKDADNFKIPRRVVFYNGITDTYILTVEGYCQIEPGDPNNFRVTCKVGKDANGQDQFIRDTLGRSDNVTYFVEQLNPTTVSKDHYKVVFKPSVLIPNFEVR
jgi:hypothetical protein